MSDMGGLGNLVANTAYLKAQSQDDKEMRKRRRTLILPQLENCTRVCAGIPKDFEDICERQPMGKTCFRQFLLASNPEYLAAAEFLEELNDWNLAEAGAKEKARQNIINKFCKTDSKSFLSYLTEDMAEKCKAVSEKDFEEVMMGQVKEATQEFLRGNPFNEYQTSPFFERFVQWKEFEKQPISDKYFYEFRTLGKGGFGEVCAVQVKNTGQMYACKKLDKKRLKKKGGEKMALLEKQILEKVNSLFLVNLAYAFDTKTHLCLVMTLMNGGDLKYHIYHIGENGIEMERIIHYTAQITTGILHLHAMDIVYRDMKPENVLLDSQGQCRLSDLGLAVELPNGKTISQKAGTKGYMAPEILKREPYRTSVDWWALGCSIYEMVAGRLPFRDHKEKVTKEEITRRTLEDKCKFEHENFDAPSKDIISLFLKKNTEERLGCKDDPRKHEFFESINIRRLEAGLITPPWVPKPNVVYAKDTGDIRDFSEVKGIEFDANDEKFFKECSTGAVPIPWQQEMIDSGLFDELNDPDRKKLSAGLNDHDDEQKSKSCTLL
ncbi:rhodopsin kinase grk7-b [Pimephales promelas]|uniref:rhodopsin kinase grk7-b n=1 Tax=Pimephales promelas TaxID=90988 RepID=UPI001955A798|nr:rhodopsin kinase grk7-b [Pimephales promelas]KAG1938757.1 G protein-coupled receptor kinase [Pimephales promelas]